MDRSTAPLACRRSFELGGSPRIPRTEYSNDVRGGNLEVATHNDDLTTRCRLPTQHLGLGFGLGFRMASLSHTRQRCTFPLFNITARQHHGQTPRTSEPTKACVSPVALQSLSRGSLRHDSDPTTTSYIFHWLLRRQLYQVPTRERRHGNSDRPYPSPEPPSQPPSIN
jgi:hypothetical protein